jgi:hypothetical protein
MSDSAPSNHEIPVAQAENKICDGCPDADSCRKVWSQPNRGPFSATGLSLGSALVFLLPLVTAIIAGAIFHRYKGQPDHFSPGEVLAATGGLLAGALLARTLLPLIRKYFHEPKPQQNHRRD